MAEAGRKILRFHYERMLAKEESTRSRQDPEDLHDMRVAARRQRAALRIVEPHFRRRVIGPVRDRLRSLGRNLGAARDLDVLLEAAQGHLAKLETQEATGFQVLLDAWRRRRDAAYTALLEYLDGPAYATFKREYEAFLDTPGWGMRPPHPGGVPRPSLVEHVLPSEILNHYGAVRAFGPSLPWASVEALHALRIEAKRLRYLLEFFREVLDSHAENAISAMIALQDHLGELQDSVVTIALVREFLAGPEAAAHAGAASAAGRYLEVRAGRIAVLRRTLDTPWKAVSGAEFRATLLASMAAL
jgi:CHAD domain-containing protein